MKHTTNAQIKAELEEITKTIDAIMDKIKQHHPETDQPSDDSGKIEPEK